MKIPHSSLINLTIVSGVGTVLIIVMPIILFFAFIFLIIPGIILFFLPILFVYLSIYFITNHAISFVFYKMGRNITSRFSNVLSVTMTVILSIAIPGLMYIEASHRIGQFSLNELIPDDMVKITGDVRIELPHSNNRHSISLALFQNPNIRSVTFSYPPIQQKQDFLKLQDGKIAEAYPITYVRNYAQNCKFIKSVELERYATKCVSEIAAIERYDYLIRLGTWRETNKGESDLAIRQPVHVDFSEIRTPDRVLARKWKASASTLAIPLALFPNCGSLYETRLCWMRRSVGNYQFQDRSDVFQYIKELEGTKFQIP